MIELTNIVFVSEMVRLNSGGSSMKRNSGGAVFWVIFLLVIAGAGYYFYPDILDGIEYVKSYVAGKNISFLSKTIREASLINGVKNGTINEAESLEQITDRSNLGDYSIFYKESFFKRGDFKCYVVYGKAANLKAVRKLTPNAYSVEWVNLRKELKDYKVVSSEKGAFAPEDSVIYYTFDFRIY